MLPLWTFILAGDFLFPNKSRQYSEHKTFVLFSVSLLLNFRFFFIPIMFFIIRGMKSVAAGYIPTYIRQHYEKSIQIKKFTHMYVYIIYIPYIFCVIYAHVKASIKTNPSGLDLNSPLSFYRTPTLCTHEHQFVYDYHFQCWGVCRSICWV